MMCDADPTAASGSPPITVSEGGGLSGVPSAPFTAETLRLRAGLADMVALGFEVAGLAVMIAGEPWGALALECAAIILLRYALRRTREASASAVNGALSGEGDVG